MEFVRSADTRRLLQTLEQLSGLSLTLAVLREQQGRAAQAAAARRAAELLSAEQTKRTHSAYASLRGLAVTPDPARTATSRPLQDPAFPLPIIRPTGPAQASGPGRVR
jgi:hypothetical protein